MSIYRELIKERMEPYLDETVSIAFDGCHKIYVLLDEEQHAETKSYGYGEDTGSFLIRTERVSDETVLDILEDWFDESCSLRFITAVRSVNGNPNDGFERVVAQFDEAFDEYEEDWDE